MNSLAHINDHTERAGNSVAPTNEERTAMLNTAMQQKATDGLNLRLSIACNTAVPFMLFGMMSRGRFHRISWRRCSGAPPASIGYSLIEYMLSIDGYCTGIADA